LAETQLTGAVSGKSRKGCQEKVKKGSTPFHKKAAVKSNNLNAILHGGHFEDPVARYQRIDDFALAPSERRGINDAERLLRLRLAKRRTGRGKKHAAASGVVE
jgi:hypothetical protein